MLSEAIPLAQLVSWVSKRRWMEYTCTSPTTLTRLCARLAPRRYLSKLTDPRLLHRWVPTIKIQGLSCLVEKAIAKWFTGLVLLSTIDGLPVPEAHGLLTRSWKIFWTPILNCHQRLNGGKQSVPQKSGWSEHRPVITHHYQRLNRQLYSRN